MTISDCVPLPPGKGTFAKLPARGFCEFCVIISESPTPVMKNYLWQLNAQFPQNILPSSLLNRFAQTAFLESSKVFPIIWTHLPERKPDCLHESHRCLERSALADPGGAPGAPAQRVHILSFWHTNFMPDWLPSYGKSRIRHWLVIRSINCLEEYDDNIGSFQILFCPSI